MVVILVLALAGLLLGTWLTFKVVRAIVHGVTGFLGGPRRTMLSRTTRALPRPSGLRCPRPKCHADNAPSARFCRRCGVAMDAGSKQASRRHPFARAAIW
ncbi:MAG TPA: hypothetical protein VF796_02625 [Humisphaera sp.]